MATATGPFKLDRSLSIAALIMMASVLLSRVIGVFREMIMARFGGTSAEMDAYVTSFIIPDILNHLLAGGFLSITFIPIFQKHCANNREDSGWESFSNLLCLGTILFIIAIVASIIFTPTFMSLLGPHIRQSENFALATKLTRIILPAQLFFYWGAFLSAVQMAKKKFFLPALAPLAYNGGIILGGILLGSRFGIEGFAWGVLAGAFIGNFALQIPGAVKAGMRFTPRFSLSHPDVKQYVHATIPLIIGLGMSFSTEFFYRYFGSFLGEGGTSSVNYALRTMMIVVAVFGQASGVAFYPYLAQLAAEKKFDTMSELLNTVLNKIACYLLPITIILIIAATPVISLLYERGKFTALSTAETASVFIVYLFGAFSYSAAIIIARSFYAMHNMVLPMVVSTSVALGTIPLYICLVPVMGSRGIALAAVIGMTLQFIVLYALWNRRYGTVKTLLGELSAFIKIVIVAVASGSIGWLVHRPLLVDHGSIGDLLSIALVSGVVVLLTAMLYELLGIQKMKDFIRGVIKKR